MTPQNRPLSPHLQVYRPQITSILSILHRLCGVALTAGALLFAFWLTSAAYGAESFARAHGFMGSILGRLILFGFTFALFYHLANGIRHLAWDTGWGYDMPTLRITGWVMVLSSLVLTLGTWAIGYAMRGGM